jgi:hypothetical protein
MKTVKHLLGFCLVSLLGYSAMAGTNKPERKLNHEMYSLLHTAEYEYIVEGVALLTYSVDNEGVVKVLNVKLPTKESSITFTNMLMVKKLN